MLLYVHYKEYLNAGNTGKLLPFAVPGNARLFIHGDVEHEAALREELLASDPQRTFLLFPSPESRRLREVVALREIRTDGHTSLVDTASSNATVSADTDRSSGMQPLRVVVLDGTWQHARGLRRMLARRVMNERPVSHISCIETGIASGSLTNRNFACTDATRSVPSS